MQSVTAWFFNSDIRTRSMILLMYELIVNVH